MFSLGADRRKARLRSPHVRCIVTTAPAQLHCTEFRCYLSVRETLFVQAFIQFIWERRRRPEHEHRGLWSFRRKLTQLLSHLSFTSSPSALNEDKRTDWIYSLFQLSASSHIRLLLPYTYRRDLNVYTNTYKNHM